MKSRRSGWERVCSFENLLLQGPGLWQTGACTAVPSEATAGEPCGPSVGCVPGLFCQGPGVYRSCVAGAGEGATCGIFGDDEINCASGLACATSDDGTTATCMPPAKLGEACTSLFQCGAQYTLSDIICDETGTHTCVHRPSAGPCIVANGINTCDPTTSYCDASTGTCTPFLSQGAACDYYGAPDQCGPWNICEWISGEVYVCVAELDVCTPQ